jgi:hypothetical protein
MTKKHLLLYLVLFGLTTACAPVSLDGPVAFVPSTAVSEAVNTPTAEATPAPTNPSLSQCDPPYSEDSIWNTPIDWQAAKIHPKSDQMVAALFKRDHWIGSNVHQYAPNIYYVSNVTPLVEVSLWGNRSFRDAITDVDVKLGQPGGVVWVPLPSDAQPAPGSDGELVVVNTETGEEWGLIKASRGLDGSWSAGGVYRYHIASSGIPPEGFAQRGAGIGSLAGIVRPCEVERGEIRHAVTIAYDYPCKPKVCAANGWPEVVPPFTKTDGEGSSQFDIPEGARLVIRPEVTTAEIEQACRGVRGCVAWVKAMQTYGGFIVDNSGHPKTYGEGNLTAHWDPALWTSDMLRNIPSDWYAVLDWKVVIN